MDADQKERERITNRLKFTSSWIAKSNILNDIIYYAGPYEVTVGKTIKANICTKSFQTIPVIAWSNFRGFWYGYDSTVHLLHGKSILIKISDKEYVFIGDNIYSFTTMDIIIDYVAPIIKNNPYCIALGKENVYFLNWKKLVPQKAIDPPISISNAGKICIESFEKQQVDMEIVDIHYKIELL